jgi:membrane associated rhomboid family serine protease
MGGIEDSQSNGNRIEGIGGISPSSQKTPNEIRNESFLTWLKNMFCPNFKYSSIIFIITCLDLIVYIITLLFGVKITQFELLAPKFETLDLFGMKYPSKIYRGQIHRLIFFGLLHANLVHLVSNILSQIILGSIIEGFIGTKKTAILYLLSNIFGGIFSCVMNFTPGVGASVAIFGFLGGYFGFTIINWNYIKDNMSYLANTIFMIFIVIMNVSYGLNNKIIDNYGHLGGFIYGFLIIFILVSPIDPNRESLWLSYEAWRKYSIIVTFVSLILLIFVFWIIQKPIE